MTSGGFRFERFILDPHDRSLRCGGEAVPLNARYFDALALLVREQGKLVSKDRFLEEVWRGVPVTDEALTQCIRTLRRLLGDDAAAPRFIETAPKHGYRFVAPVEWVEGLTPKGKVRSWPTRAAVLRAGVAGTLGGGGAGALGGLLYGSVAASGVGQVSGLMVFILLTMLIGLVGGAGVAFGAAAGASGARALAGGALGGLVVGAVVRLVGLDAFDMLFGQAPEGMTGGAEGMVLGAAVGLGVWLGGPSPRRAAAAGGVAGAMAGVLICVLGGRLLGGSLSLLAERFPASRLSLDGIGRLVGEADFGRVSQTLAAGLEGLLFCAAVAGTMVLAGRRAT